MWSNIGATGALALFGVVAARVVIMIVALRGTKPEQRAEIIRALNKEPGPARPRRRERWPARRRASATKPEDVEG
ncbi:hypothetical protein SK571_31035 [Lentzea sp. BCCO 10_0798]|uniref:Uncharacterized protein n=1 Tax=Lentzea kristufekii TaxID=3095430 RepID=A0ABU4TZT0_9PSEU|nr:hypothetical protein [Lentzea sp. BCCO 10_0798]MDX8053826.1 hypothetical protein [Lentzea sp. BCCO 10_0798]